MSDTNKFATSRYYVAEASVWVLGVILIFSRIFGRAPSQIVPIVEFQPKHERDFSRIVAILLVAAVLYMWIEWKQSSRVARGNVWQKLRVAITFLFAGGALWISYPLITHGSALAKISPAWLLGFSALGLALGFLASAIALSALMIRTSAEAKRLRLPRIPIATRGQFLVGIPLVALLLSGVYVFFRHSPIEIPGVASFATGIPYLLMIIVDLPFLFFAHNEHGERISYATRIAQLKEIHSFHDYAYHLNNHGAALAKAHQIPSSGSPESIQKAIREAYSSKTGTRPLHFRAQIQEKSEIRIYPKDGNSTNKLACNLGVRLLKEASEPGLLRLLITFDDPDEKSREMAVPTALVEAYCEAYLASHPHNHDFPFREMLSHAINQAVIASKTEMGAPSLITAAMAGDEGSIRELLKKREVNVNERADFGWTALLGAAAQGYPQVVALLLKAGADPDIGNVEGVTPLMYGVRYGNLPICELLLEYGATVNTRDVYGETALMLASRDGYFEVVRLLLSNGANSAIRSKEGKTALDFAQDNKQGEIARILRYTAKNS
jgi:hypothetical protein